MSDKLWSFGEHPYYKFTKTSSSHHSFFNFTGGIEASEGGIYLTESHLNLGDKKIQLTDIENFRLIFLPERRLFEIELKPGYPEKYVFIANYRSMKGVMGGSFEMIYLFSYLCKLLKPKPRDYRLTLQDVEIDISFDKPVYYPGENVKLVATFGKKIPRLTIGIDVTISSNISTWKPEGVIIQGHSYHQEYTSTHNYGKKCIEFTKDNLQKSVQLEYTLPQHLIFPMLNTHGRPFEMTHEVTIRYKRRFMQDIYVRYLIPFLPRIKQLPVTPIKVSNEDTTVTLDKNTVRSKDSVEIDVKLNEEIIYDSIRVEFLRRISYRVYRVNPRRLNREVLLERDTESFTIDSDICLSEVSNVHNFPFKITIPHEVYPSFINEPLVQFSYFIRVVFVKKLARDNRIEVPITFYPDWEDFRG